MGKGNGGRAGDLLAGARVLVAEDDAVIALDMDGALKSLGCTVLGPVPSAAEALALLALQEPRAALVNIRLSDGPGTPVVQALRAAAVPFILVTGYEGRDLDDPALRAAPRLTKPFSAWALEAALVDLLGGPQP